MGCLREAGAQGPPRQTGTTMRRSGMGSFQSGHFLLVLTSEHLHQLVVVWDPLLLVLLWSPVKALAVGDGGGC